MKRSSGDKRRSAASSTVPQARWRFDSLVLGWKALGSVAFGSLVLGWKALGSVVFGSVAFGAVALASCRSPSDAAPTPPAPAPVTSATLAPVTSAAPAPAPAAASRPSALHVELEALHAELDELDRRTPVPLLPSMAHHQKQSMHDHLVAVQQIVGAAAESDYEAVARAARRIGSSEQMAAMCTHMGSGAPGFTERALAFHQTADAIGAAARERDTSAVLSALSATLQACTGCHASFKQALVPSLTGAGTPPGSHSERR